MKRVFKALAEALDSGEPLVVCYFGGRNPGTARALVIEAYDGIDFWAHEPGRDLRKHYKIARILWIEFASGKRIDLRPKPDRGGAAAPVLAPVFSPPPKGWGLRGDPFLWTDLAARLGGRAAPPSRSAFLDLVIAEFSEATGRSPYETDTIYVEAYAHGGMSSGHISCEFWRERVFPLLERRYLRLMRAD